MSRGMGVRWQRQGVHRDTINDEQCPSIGSQDTTARGSWLMVTSSISPLFTKSKAPRISARVDATIRRWVPLPNIIRVTSLHCNSHAIRNAIIQTKGIDLTLSVFTCGRNLIPKRFTSSNSMLVLCSRTGLLSTSVGVGSSLAGRPM